MKLRAKGEATNQPAWLDKAFELITNEGEERSCRAISEDACHEMPGNFFKNMLSGAASKLAEQLVSAGTTLPWIFSALGVPVSFTGVLVPVKDAGSLLPQLFVSAKIRAFARRKWFWVFAALFQSAMLVAMAFAVLLLTGATAGFVILLSLLLFSIAGGVGSIAFSDVMAKTVSRGKRGQLLALRASVGGILSLAAGLYLYDVVAGTAHIGVYFWMIILSAILLAFAAFSFALIREEKGATAGGKTPVKELKDAWRFFREDQNLRRFIFTRGLLMAIPLSQPFFIVLGQQQIGTAASSLGIVVIAAGLANIVSSPFWGRFSDKSSRRMMRVVALMGIVNILLMLSFSAWPDIIHNAFGFAFLLLLQVMAHAGARLSRKTYLVDFAPEKDRPSYVSLSNTAIGIFTLIAAAFGLLAGIFGIELMLLLYALLLLGAWILAGKLKEV